MVPVTDTPSSSSPSNARRLATNSLAATLSNYTTMAVKVVVNLYFFRVLTVDMIDSYQAVYAMINLFTIFADFGIDAVLVREYAKADAQQRGRILFNGLLIRLALAAVAVSLCIGFTWSFDLPTQILHLTWFFSLSIFLGIWPLFHVPFRAAITNVAPVLIGAVVILFSLGTKATLVWMSAELKWFFIAATAFEGIKLVLLYRYYHKKSPVRMTCQLDTTVIKRLLRLGIPSAILSTASIIHMRIDQAMLVVMDVAKGELANYSLAVMIAEIVKMLLIVVVGVSMPLMVRHAKEDPERFRFLVDRIHKYISILLVPALVFVSLFPKQILFLLFNDKYQPAMDMLPWLTVAVAFSVYFSLIFQIAFSTQREKKLLPVVLGASALNLILNWLWIPQYGGLGAAYATVITYGMNYLACMLIIDFRVIILRNLRTMLVPMLLSGLLIAPVRYWDLDDGLLLISALVYLPLLWSLGYVDQADRDVLKAVLAKD